MEEDQNPHDSTKVIEQLSIFYQTLADSTAFFGVIKQKDKADGELKSIKIPIVSAVSTSAPAF